eukprot:jgi/Tetstr1/465757/TSEL_010382.t1
MLCYGVFTAYAHAALTDAVAKLRAENATARDTADANYDLLDSAIRTIATNGGNGKTSGRAIKSYGGSRRASGSPSSTTVPPPTTFHKGISMHDATPAQLTFLEGKLARFVESGAWEFGTCRKWVSRLFLVLKPGVNQWRYIIDLRVLNSYCVRERLKMEDPSCHAADNIEADRHGMGPEIRSLRLTASLSLTPNLKDLAGVNPCFRIFDSLHPNTARPGQRGANARRPGQRRPNARRPGQPGANAPRPGQRGANAPQPGQRGANAPRPGQRGANLPRPGIMLMIHATPHTKWFSAI